jgi:hypothetical protein
MTSILLNISTTSRMVITQFNDLVIRSCTAVHSDYLSFNFLASSVADIAIILKEESFIASIEML